MTALLRALAIATAVAALLDPPLTMMARGRPRVAIALQHPDRTEEQRLRESLTARLTSGFDVVAGQDDSAAAAVLVGNDYYAMGVPDEQRAYTVTMGPRSNEAEIRIVAVRAPADAPIGTRIHLEADVEARNVSGRESILAVRTGDPDVEVARVVHRWASTQETWRAQIDVTPIGPPPWHLRLDAHTPGAPAHDDGSADSVVDGAEPASVLFVDLRPSWPSTFVRRALERDPRFDVASVSYPARGITVSTGDATSLRTISLESVRALAVGGLDRLAAPDAGILTRFMRERGGSVLLLPDSLADIRAAAKGLPSPASTELLLENPLRLATEAPLEPFEASELLRFAALPISRVVARTTGQNEPVVFVSPVGAGRLMVSGALDAWRYRANDKEAFDRFWQSAVSGLAAESPSAIEVEIAPSVVAPAHELEVRARVRRSAFGVTPADGLAMSATLSGSNDPVRLWPEPAPDSFRGSFIAPDEPGVARLLVRAGNHATASRAFVVSARARTARPSGLPLVLLAESHGGIDVTPDQIAELAQRLRRDVRAPWRRVERRPMRSIWWILPFAGCLCGEWWLRRSRGLS